MIDDDLLPLHVGASGFVAQVCRHLNIRSMVNNLVTWDDTQCKRSPGTLMVALIINMLVTAVRSIEFGRPSNTWTSRSCLMSRLH